MQVKTRYRRSIQIVQDQENSSSSYKVETVKRSKTTFINIIVHQRYKLINKFPMSLRGRGNGHKLPINNPLQRGEGSEVQRRVHTDNLS